MGQFDVACGDSAGVVRGEIDGDAVPDVAPFRMVVHRFDGDGRCRHESESMDEVGEFQVAVELGVGDAPAGEFREFGMDGRIVEFGHVSSLEDGLCLVVGGWRIRGGMVARRIVFLWAFATFGQRDHVLSFARVQTAQGMADIGAAVRVIADVEEPVVDPLHRTLTIRGTDQQRSVAEWLVKELDRPGEGSYLQCVRASFC